MTSCRFSFTKLLVTDLESSAEFYEKVFGMERTFRIPYELNDRALEEIIFTSDSGPTFGLLKFDGVTKASSDEVILGFSTTDMEGVFARVVSAGGAVVRPPRAEAEWGVTVGFVTDNGGHLLEVTQPLQ